MSEENKKSLISTFKPYPFKFQELPLSVIEGDPNQPRKAFGLQKGGDHNRLLKSISHYGIEDPIKVSEVGEGRYIIMDGHRRFACAKDLKFEKVPCRVYPKMSEGEFEARRYEMQNNRRSWKPIEKANAIHKIKSQYKDATKKEVADLIGITQPTLFHYTKLRDMRMEYLELMAENNLKEYQRVGFMRLLPKLRKIKTYEVDDIIKILFKKINDNVVYREKDFTTIGKVFKIASISENEIVGFLTEPKMTAEELFERTQLSGFSSKIKDLISELAKKKNLDIQYTSKEQELISDLYELIKHLL